MAAYLDLATFRSLTLMPGTDVDAVEAGTPGWIATQLEYYSRDIDARLRKRYVVPFTLPAPEVVRQWLTRLVTVQVFLKRGIDPDDRQFASIQKSADDTDAKIKEAADLVDGLYDLPLLDDGDGSAIAKGGPLVYSEASPYVWTDVQRSRATDEDRNGSGTGG